MCLLGSGQPVNCKSVNLSVFSTGIPTHYTEGTEIRDLDMILTKEQLEALDTEVGKYKGIKGNEWRWPGGVIPYETDGTFSEYDGIIKE